MKTTIGKTGRDATAEILAEMEQAIIFKRFLLLIKQYSDDPHNFSGGTLKGILSSNPLQLLARRVAGLSV